MEPVVDTLEPHYDEMKKFSKVFDRFKDTFKLEQAKKEVKAARNKAKKDVVMVEHGDFEDEDAVKPNLKRPMP